MCRLAIIPPKLLKERSNDVLTLLDVLESVNGGHGNGAAAWLRNGSVWLQKGAKLSNEELIRHMIGVVDDVATAFIYHTRLATHGSVDDENAQPFVAPEDGYPILILAHNGIWYHYRVAAAEIGIGLRRTKRCYKYRSYGYFWWYEGVDSDGDDGYAWCYEDETLAVDRSDSWVMAQWLAKMIRGGVDRREALRKLYETLGYDAVLVQFSDGETYIVTKKYVEAAKIDGQWLIASSNISDAFPGANVLSIRGIWKYSVDGGLYPVHNTRVESGPRYVYGTAVCGIGGGKGAKSISAKVSLGSSAKDRKRRKSGKGEKKQKRVYNRWSWMWSWLDNDEP